MLADALCIVYHYFVGVEVGLRFKANYLQFI